MFEKLPREGKPVDLRTYHVVREDSQKLFGLEQSERICLGSCRRLQAWGHG
jgi:Holliday junction resolvasome RuvABC DNA-binding subunit